MSEKTAAELTGLVADAIRAATERGDPANPFRGASVVPTRFVGDTMFTVHRADGSVWFDVKVVRKSPD